MKKVLIIASAVVAILYSVFFIAQDVEFFNYSCYVIGELAYWDGIHQLSIRIAAICFVAFISLLVLFKIRLPTILRILSLIISVTLVILTIMFAYSVIYFLITSKDSISYMVGIVNVISLTAIFITLLTYIRRTFKKAPDKK